MARFVRRLASFGRLIRFDAMRTGLSEQGSPEQPPDCAQRVADAVAVLDAAGANRAVVVAPYTAAGVGVMLTAGQPERIERLVRSTASPASSGHRPTPQVFLSMPSRPPSTRAPLPMPWKPASTRLPSGPPASSATRSSGPGGIGAATSASPCPWPVRCGGAPSADRRAPPPPRCPGSDARRGQDDVHRRRAHPPPGGPHPRGTVRRPSRCRLAALDGRKRALARRDRRVRHGLAQRIRCGAISGHHALHRPRKPHRPGLARGGRRMA
jgi:hypothetical protein